MAVRLRVTTFEKVRREMCVEEEEEIWIKHYSSKHQILLVGDGDFSLSLSLAMSFGSASNIVASSLDSYVEVINKYKNAKSNLQKLEKLGASHLHGVDATKMLFHRDLKMLKFDRIIFSFPHAGFSGKEHDARLIKKHRKLVRAFFGNARCMLKAHGEVHVNHKTTPPFCCWNLEELASQHSLALIERAPFKRRDYPGYRNKKGDGAKCDEHFFLGKCSTYMFRVSHSVDKSMVRAHICSPQMHYQWDVYPNDEGFEQLRRVSYPSHQCLLHVPSRVCEWPVVYAKDGRFEQPYEVLSECNEGFLWFP